MKELPTAISPDGSASQLLGCVSCLFATGLVSGLRISFKNTHLFCGITVARTRANRSFLYS